MSRFDPARYSSFDPDRWWETRGGVRIEIIELQKLVLDVVLHPMSILTIEPFGVLPDARPLR